MPNGSIDVTIGCWQLVTVPAGIPRWCSGKEPPCQCKSRRFSLWVRNMPWRREWQLTPVFLPGEFRGQRSLAGYRPRGHKESDTTEHAYTYCTS